MPRFPAEKLVARGATITAQLNGAPGGPRGVYLGFTINIEFRPIEYADSEFECEMGWDLMPIPGVRDWRKLEGVEFEGTNPGKDGKEAVEGAFLLNEFSGATFSSIKFGKRQGARFPIEAVMDVDFEGWAKGDDKPFRVVARTSAVFKGLRVPHNLDRAGAVRLAAEHMDLAAFEELPAGQTKPSFTFLPLLSAEEKAAESAAAAAQAEANKPPPPPPPPETIELGKGLSLVHVEAPTKPELTKPRAKVPGFVKGKDSLMRTLAPGCILAEVRSKLKVVVVKGKVRRVVKLPEFPDQVLAAWSSDAALVESKNALYRIALPSGNATRVWRPPAGDGVYPLAGDKAFWIATPRVQPFGPGRVVVYTPKRVLVLEEKSGKFRTLAEHETDECLDVIPFGAGRFLLVKEGNNRFVLLGLKDGRLRTLAKVKYVGTFSARQDGVVTEKYQRDRYYALDGHEALLAKAK